MTYLENEIRHRVFIIIALILFFAENGHALWKYEYRGYAKSMLVVSDYSGITISPSDLISDHDTIDLSLLNIGRLELTSEINPYISGEIAYELSIDIKEDQPVASFFNITSSHGYRAFDIDETPFHLSEGSDLRVTHNLDRAFITLSLESVDIYIGRQPISFGSARVVNPTDVFTSRVYNDLNKEERDGVDAVRVRIPVGEMSEIDTGIVSGDDFKGYESGGFLRVRINYEGMDIIPSVIVFKENLAIGLDLATSLGDAGYWLEMAYTFADVLDDHDPSFDYLRVSTGLDYSFSRDIYGYLEYHYNGAGSSDTDGYVDIISGTGNQVAYGEGRVYLLSRHYISPGFSYQISPLTDLSIEGIMNLRDHSILISPGINHSLSDEMLLRAGAFIGIGRRGHITQQPLLGIPVFTIDSEFGYYPDVYFVSVVRYF